MPSKLITSCLLTLGLLTVANAAGPPGVYSYSGQLILKNNSQQTLEGISSTISFGEIIDDANSAHLKPGQTTVFTIDHYLSGQPIGSILFYVNNDPSKPINFNFTFPCGNGGINTSGQASLNTEVICSNHETEGIVTITDK